MVGDAQWEELVIPRRLDVINALRPTLLLDRLRVARLLTQTEYGELQQGSMTEQNRSQKLVTDLLVRKEGSFAKFCEVLSAVEGQRHIVTEILKLQVSTPPLKDMQTAASDMSTTLRSLPEEHTAASTAMESQTNEINTSASMTTCQNPIVQQGSPSSRSQEETARSTAAEKHKQIPVSCSSANARKKYCATFFFKPEHLEWIKGMNTAIRSMCAECFRIDKENVLLAAAEADEMESMIKEWKQDINHPVYLDTNSILAVLLVEGVKPNDILDRHRRQLQLFIVVEILPYNSSFIVLQLSTNLFVHLLCALGERATLRALSESLQEILPEATRAVLRLGGLPPLQFYDQGKGHTQDAKHGVSEVDVKDEGDNLADKDINKTLQKACKEGDVWTVTRQISIGADTTTMNEHGQTPLHIAAAGEKDCPEACEILLKHNAKIGAMDKDGQQPLHLASFTGHLETGKLLLSHGADAGAVDKHGQTPLHRAAVGEKDCPEMCEILLKHHAKIDAVDSKGNQPLHLASWIGHTETGTLLVSYGANTNATNKHGYTPLHAAATKGKDCPGLCEALLKCDAKVDAVNENGDRPLHMASWKGHLETGKLLLCYGADTNAVNKRGQTPLHRAAGGEKDCPTMCRVLLKHNARVDAVDENGAQPLHWASHVGHLETVELLMSHGADTTAANKHGYTSLHTAAIGEKDCPEVCEILLKYNAEIDATDGHGDQPLHFASFKGHLETAKLLLSHEATTDAVNKDGQTPLHRATAGEKDCPELCESLLKRSAKIDATDESGSQPLHYASWRGHTITGKLLVSRGADTNALTKHRQTPLHAAATGQKDCSKMCEVLLNHDAKIDAVDEDGNQPLHSASLKGHEETCKLLVSHEADTNAVNKCACTPLHIAATAERDCPGLCQTLLKHHANICAVDESGNQPLHKASYKGHTETVKLLVSHGADTNAVNKHGHTPLHYATIGIKDCPKLCDILLKHNAKIDAVDGDGCQPLYLASIMGHVETVELLVSNGAHTNTMTKYGRTPLHAAASREKDCPELCQVLLKQDAKVKALDEMGNQPLHYASRNGHAETVKLLVSHGADTNAVNKSGHTPLQIAATGEKDCPELCQILLSHHAKIDAVNEFGNQPLHFASWTGHAETSKLLVSLGADINAVNKHGYTPLCVAATGQKDCPELCKYFLEQNSKIDAVNEDGDQPLHLASSSGHAETSKLLVSHGADTNAVNKRGNTPLHSAASARKDCPELCEVLLKHHAKIDAVNEDGNQPLHFASLRGNVETGKLLVSNGADTTVAAKNGVTPLHATAAGENDCPDLCHILLKHHAKVDAVNDHGHQPLHFAAVNGHPLTGKLLVSHGADTNAVTKSGQTPLHTLATGENDCPELCEILLIHGTKVDAVDDKRNQPLHIASFQGHAKTGKLLIAHGADTNAVNKQAETPLHKAAAGDKDCPKLCESLLIHHAKIDALDDTGNQPLHFTAVKGHLETGKLLLSFGAETNAINGHGQTALHMVAVGEKDCPELCESLLKHSAQIDAVDSNLNQPLHLASWKSHSKIGIMLVSHGADTNAVNQHGHTPLCIAAVGLKDCPELCEVLLQHGAKIDAVDENGHQPLHLAILRGHTETGKLLVRRAADTNAVNGHGQRPLQSAATGEKDSPDLCDVLLKHGAKIDALDDDYGNQALRSTSWKGHTETGKLLLSHGADANAVNKHGLTPLHIAARGEKDCPKMCEILLKYNARIDAVNEVGVQPLHLASRAGYAETVELLVSCGADTNAKTKQGQTPLHTAATGEKDNPGLCEILLKHNAKIDAVDISGSQPLHNVCLEGHTETCKLLVSHGADTNKMNKYGRTPLHKATSGKKDCPELCAVLLKHNAKIDAMDEDGVQPLHLASLMGHINVGKLLVSHGADTNAVTKHGQTPLHTGATGEKDCPNVCETLLKLDAKIDASDEAGNQTLHLASWKGHSETAKFLAAYGANVNAMTKHGQTPLHMAAVGEKDCPELCEILLTYGAKIDAVDESGDRPLHLASWKGHSQTVKLLVSRGADANAVNNKGQTPLHSAARGDKSCLELCEILLKHHAKIDAVDEYGNQPLHLTTWKGLTETSELLLSYGADTNAVNKHGHTPLHHAANREEDCPELCEILLKHRAKIDAVDAKGVQPLHLASLKGHVKTAELLMSYGADTNAETINGHTPLHTAAAGEKDCPDLCELLLKHNAKIDVVDKNGNLPLHLASFRRHTGISNILVSRGADTNAVNKRGHTPLRRSASGEKVCLELFADLLRHFVKPSVTVAIKHAAAPREISSLEMQSWLS